MAQGPDEAPVESGGHVEHEERSVAWLMLPRNVDATTASAEERTKMNAGKSPDPKGPISDLWSRHSSLSMEANRRLSSSRPKAQPTSTSRMKMSSRPSPSTALILSTVP